MDANVNFAVLPIRRLDQAALEQFQLSNEVALICWYARRNAVDTFGTIHTRAAMCVSVSPETILHVATLAFIRTITVSSV